MSILMRAARSLALLLMLTVAPQVCAGGVLLVFGDSLSAAYGVPAGKSWVDLLAVRLQERKRGLGARVGDAQEMPFAVVNASASGETTQGGITRIGDALARHRPQVVILELGGNDALRGLVLSRTKDNLARMIAQARASGARVLLLGMQAPPNLGPAFTQRFAALYRELHQELNVAWVPFFLQGVALNPALMQSDGIHPTTQAQPLLLDNIWPALQALLDEDA
jgi:acyl-CoA thioesterase-1